MGWPLWIQFLIDILHHYRSSQQTPHGSSVRVIHGVTSVSSISDWYITSLQVITTDTPWLVCKGDTWGDLCDALHHYKILTTDTPWLVFKGDTLGDLCEFKFWLMYHITTGSSQQTPHGSSAKATHGVSPASSNSDRCIIITAFYRILTADTPRIVREDNTWGVLREFRFSLIYHITTGSSQQTHHGPPAKATHPG